MPITEDSQKIILIGVSAVVILFSFLFIPGKGLVHLLQWRGSYLRICLIILFLCLACIPYVIIRKPVPYTEVINISLLDN